ncbi:MAG: hypothetical protein Q8Q42_03030 [Nanoarchaeota archaeon]|nr:hypothetical protein [Nanoarchaeota archaeon]
MKKYIILFFTIFIIGCAGIQEPVACSTEAKICPDGSAVGRVGPDCEFEKCPTDKIPCTDEQKNAKFCIEIDQPACGWFNEDIQCTTFPCAETFSNNCFACMDDKVESWTDGECPKPA